MKPKTLILMGVAVACGLLASFMTSRLIAERGNQNQDGPKGKVLVAKKKLKSMTALTKPEDLFVEKELPLDAVPKKAVTSFEQLKGSRLNKMLNEEMFVTTDDLVSKQSEGLGADLPPGYRAIGLKVNPETLAGGFILPGARVDVVYTSREGEAVSQIILQNMLVLAVDLTSERDPDKGKAMLGNTVTLAARPEEATRLTLAAGTGDLRLLLRGVEDNTAIVLRGTKFRDLQRPLADAGAANQETTPVASSATVKVPDLPDAPNTAPDKPMTDEPKVEEPPPVRKHVLKITSGQTTDTYEYIVDGRGWKTGAVQREQDEQPRDAKLRRVAPRAPAVQAPPAQAPEQPRQETANPRPLTPEELLLKNSPLPPVSSVTNE